MAGKKAGAVELAILLVPGACLTRQHYSIFAQCVSNVGIQITVCDLISANGEYTGCDYELDVLQISQELAILLAQNKNIIIIAHSYGGLPACEALATMPPSTGGSLLGVVFTTAFVPQLGMSLRELRSGRSTDLFRFENFQCWITDAHETLFNETLEPVKTEFSRSLVPHNAEVFTAPSMSDQWKKYPCAYIKCSRDKALSPDEQEDNINRLEKRIVSELPTGDHFPFGSCPMELLSSILDLIEGFKQFESM